MSNNSISWKPNDIAERYAKEKCKEQNCEIKIGSSIAQKFIIDVENFWIQNSKSGKVSDCLILCVFGSKKRIVIVELKGKSPDVLEVKEKMRNVCEAIPEFVEEYSLTNFDFYPILLSKSMGPIETRLLRTIRISFGNHTEYMIRERCNVSLEYIFRKYE